MDEGKERMCQSLESLPLAIYLRRKEWKRDLLWSEEARDFPHPV